MNTDISNKEEKVSLENWKSGRIGNSTYKVITQAAGILYTEKYVELLLEAQHKKLVEEFRNKVLDLSFDDLESGVDRQIILTCELLEELNESKSN